MDVISGLVNKIILCAFVYCSYTLKPLDKTFEEYVKKFIAYKVIMADDVFKNLQSKYVVSGSDIFIQDNIIYKSAEVRISGTFFKGGHPVTLYFIGFMNSWIYLYSNKIIINDVVAKND